ncbi:hypothetical protein [Azospirillum endophyticum]
MAMGGGVLSLLSQQFAVAPVIIVEAYRVCALSKTLSGR